MEGSNWSARAIYRIRLNRHDREQAHKLIEQRDPWRQSYLRNFHNADWNDPLLYDLTINTGKIDREDAVDLLPGFLAE